MSTHIEWKKEKYLQACRIFELYEEKHKVCNVRKENGCVTCNSKFTLNNDICCYLCSHLTPTGCDTKSLGCKFSYCLLPSTPAQMNLCSIDSIIEADFNKLKDIIIRFFKKHDIPLHPIRMSLEDTFKIYNGERSIEDYQDTVAKFI